MMKNNTLQELGEIIRGKEQILIFPHISMDGDALGSAVALCRALRQMGKTCYILIEDDVPGNLRFLDQGCITADNDAIPQPDLSICIDCGNAARFPKRKEKFDSAPVTICIDHHSTTEAYCDYNHIDSSRGATGELIYDLLCVMHHPIDQEIGEALFAAITTDTGNFQYSNTSKRSHEIMASLYDAGIDANRVSIELYENLRVEKLMLHNRILDTLSLICGGRGAIAYMTKEMMTETGAKSDETEGIVQTLRSIHSVEVAAFLKEAEDGRIKISLRSKRDVDVAEITEAFGGGGHKKAAGCTMDCTLGEAFDAIKERIVDSLGKL